MCLNIYKDGINEISFNFANAIFRIHIQHTAFDGLESKIGIDPPTIFLFFHLL